jgi:hypothetical protein
MNGFFSFTLIKKFNQFFIFLAADRQLFPAFGDNRVIPGGLEIQNIFELNHLIFCAVTHGNSLGGNLFLLQARQAVTGRAVECAGQSGVRLQSSKFSRTVSLSENGMLDVA